MARQGAPVQLTAGERKDLRELLKSGVMPARTVIRALALLRLDGGMSVGQVAGLLELTGEGVRKIVLRYRAGGLEAAVYEAARPGKNPALDSAQKQKVIALACSPAPAGYARWTIRLRWLRRDNARHHTQLSRQRWNAHTRASSAMTA